MEEGEQQLPRIRLLLAGEGPFVRADARRPRGGRGYAAPRAAHLAADDRRTAAKHCTLSKHSTTADAVCGRPTVRAG